MASDKGLASHPFFFPGGKNRLIFSVKFKQIFRNSDNFACSMLSVALIDLAVWVLTETLDWLDCVINISAAEFLRQLKKVRVSEEPSKRKVKTKQ